MGAVINIEEMKEHTGFSQVQEQQGIQTQQQKLTAQQMMVVQMLQLGTLEMEERVRAELQDNPVLEEAPEDERHDAELDEEDPSASDDDDTTHEIDGDFTGSNEGPEDDYGDSDDTYDYSGRGVQREEIPIDAGTSFLDELIEQLHEQPLDEEEQLVGEFIIGLLDDNGFLTMDPSRIVDELAFKESLYVTQDTVEKVLACIRSFDPAGIGARDIRECLRLQLMRREHDAASELALRILDDCFEHFASQQWSDIPVLIGADEESTAHALQLLTSLNPRPGSALGEMVGNGSQQLVPDFIVDDNGDTLYVDLNNANTPELRVSREYRDMLNEQKRSSNRETREAAQFLQQKLDKAQSFVEAVHQRNRTMRTVMQAIANVQKDFFLTGDEDMLHPLILSDIAEASGYDISTVSRVCSGKSVQTAFGVYPLKLFFSNKRVQLGDGSFVNSSEVLKVFQDIIASEDKTAPYNDTELVNLLLKAGFNVARRTVVKYRQKLGIPTAAERKRDVSLLNRQ